MCLQARVLPPSPVLGVWAWGSVRAEAAVGACCLGLAWWQPRPHSDATHSSSQNLLPTPLVLSSVHELDLFR